MEYILPPVLFDNAPTLLLLAGLAGAVLLVSRGADLLVDGSVGIAARLGIPKVIVGATLVSLGTTAPEAAVSVMSAFKGMPDFALGNSVGSIICNTALIFGLCAVLTPLPADRFVLNRHGWLLLGSAALLVVVSSVFRDADGAPTIPRAVGVAFVALLAAYMWMSVIWARQHGEFQGLAQDLETEPIRKEVGHMALGLLMVVLASHIMIQSVRVLCVRWGVPPSILAATLIAFGTSLPEFVTAIACVVKGHGELLVGNIIGANILNVLFVTGAAACASPLKVDPLFFRLHFPVMLFVLILFRSMVRSEGGTFGRRRGWVLLAVFVAYVVGNVVLG